MEISLISKEITPQQPEYFSGYSRSSKSQGANDPLKLILLRIKNETFNLFIFSVDLLNVEKNFSDKLTKKVNSLYPDQYNLVLISAIHTHSGPAVFKLPSLEKEVNPLLVVDILNQAFELIIESETSLIKADCAVFDEGEIEGLYGNRNVLDSYSDKSFSVIKFIKNNQIIAAWVNLACHPTILKADNLLFSADLLGNVREQLEKDWQCPVILLNGACGDVSSRFYTQGASYEEVERIGTQLTKQIISSKNSKELHFDLLQASSYEKDIYYEASKDAFWQKKAKELEAMPSSIQKEVLQTHLSNKFLKLEKMTRIISKQLEFKDFVILTFSGELTSAFEKIIRQSISKPVIIIGFEHDYCSYLVDSNEYGQYFESYLTRLPKGAADVFVEKTINLLKK